MVGLTRGAGVMMSVVFAVYIPTCGTPKIMRSGSPSESPMAELWQRPDEISSSDLFYGPWGEKLARRADRVRLSRKACGTNPGDGQDHQAVNGTSSSRRTTTRRKGRSRLSCPACCQRSPSPAAVYFLPSFITISTRVHTDRADGFVTRPSLKDDGPGRGNRIRSSARDRIRGCWSY